MLNKFPTTKMPLFLQPATAVTRCVSMVSRERERPIFRKIFEEKESEMYRPLLRFDRHSDLSPDQ